MSRRRNRRFDLSGFPPDHQDPTIVVFFKHKLVKAIRDPKNNAILIERGADPVGSTIEEHEKFIRVEIDKWMKVAKAAGIEPQ